MIRQPNLRTRVALFCVSLFVLATFAGAFSVGHVVEGAVVDAFALGQGQPPESGPNAAEALEAKRAQVRSDIRTRVFLTILIGMICAVVGAEALAGRMLRPLRKMALAAASVKAASEGVRLPISRADDELQDLALTINAMLDRIDVASDAQRHFVADASHELRTPLALLATEIDVALENRCLDLESARETLTVIRGDVRRSELLIDSLLMIARSGAVAHVEPVPLGEICRSAVGSCAEPSRVEVNLADVSVSGDAVLLKRLVENLLANALAYGSCDRPVALSIEQMESWARLSVANSGQVLDQEQIDGWFGRFSRGDQTSLTPGFGLGLGIVSNIVRAHSGEIKCWPQDSGGAVVQIDLPSFKKSRTSLGRKVLASTSIDRRS